MLAVSTAKTNSYLDPRTRSAEVLEFESELRQRIVGSHRPEGTTTMFHQSKVAPCRAGRRKTKFLPRVYEPVGEGSRVRESPSEGNG